jgi:hypothetical protein
MVSKTVSVWARTILPRSLIWLPPWLALYGLEAHSQVQARPRFSRDAVVAHGDDQRMKLRLLDLDWIALWHASIPQLQLAAKPRWGVSFNFPALAEILDFLGDQERHDGE